MMAIPATTTFDFVCYGCGHIGPAGPRGARCPQCGEPLSLRSLATPPADLLTQQPASMWHYAPLLPIQDEAAIITIGEGATPLVEARRLNEKYDFAGINLKWEAANPTGSFKDRQISVGMSHARELGIDTVACVSSGNVACATAAYAARAGMRAVLFMHGMAGPGKTAQAAAYGAQIFQVDTPSAGAVFDLCLEACEQFGWYHISTAGLYEPYNVEGSKTIAYELYQGTGGDLPEWVVAPVGGGGLLGGMWRGFLDLQRLGLIAKPPRLVGVQAAGCAPLVKAIDEEMPFLDTLEHPWPNPETIAGGIADDILFDGHTALPAIRTTGGAAFAVDDEAILEAEVQLASTEGLLVEPTCSGVVAALPQLAERAAGQRVCCVLTGTGIKELSAIADRVPRPARIRPDLSEVERALGGGA